MFLDIPDDAPRKVLQSFVGVFSCTDIVYSVSSPFLAPPGDVISSVLRIPSSFLMMASIVWSTLDALEMIAAIIATFSIVISVGHLSVLFLLKTAFSFVHVGRFHFGSHLPYTHTHTHTQGPLEVRLAWMWLVGSVNVSHEMTAIWTFHLKCHIMCLSVILLCYRITFMIL